MKIQTKKDLIWFLFDGICCPIQMLKYHLQAINFKIDLWQKKSFLLCGLMHFLCAIFMLFQNFELQEILHLGFIVF